MSAAPSRLLIGTRGSALALAQTREVARLLQETHPGLVVEEQIIKTTGDRRLDISLSRTTSLDKGLFTRELEDALQQGHIDLAVHSLKDLPTSMAEAFTIGAILPREDPSDLLLYHHEASTGGPQISRLATSSPRRARQMQELYPCISCQEIRGNVPTRLRKLCEAQDLDAMVLALAGLKRLGLCDADGKWTASASEFHSLRTALLPALLPAPGQGAVAVQIRSADSATAQLLAPLHCPDTATCVEAERALLGELGGGCHLALGARGTICADSPLPCLHLNAVFFPEDNPSAPPWRGQASGDIHDPASVARKLRAQWPD